MADELVRKESPNLIRRLIEPNPSIVDIGAQSQIRFLSGAALVTGLVSIIGLIIAIAVGSSVKGASSAAVPAFVSLIILSIIVYWLSRTRLFVVGSVLLSFGLALVGYGLVGGSQPVAVALYSTVPLAFILATALLPLWGVIILVGFNTLITLSIAFSQIPNIDTQAVYIASGILTGIGIFLIVTILFRNAVEDQRLKESSKINQNLRELRESLEKRVEERTQQVRTASEIAQKITSSLSLDEMLDRTVNLIVDGFGYYHAGIFLIDEASNSAVLRAARSPAAKQMLESGHRLGVGSSSIIGWVTSNKEPRMASNVAEDPQHLKNELLPETQAEVGIPIIAGDQLLGALDVQSTNVNSFDEDTVAMLQTLAGQIASAVQNVRYIEAAQVNLQGVSEVYRTSYQIAQAKTNEEVFEAAQRVFQRTPYTAILLIAENDIFRITTTTDPTQSIDLTKLPNQINVLPEEVLKRLGNKILVEETSKLSALYHAQFYPELQKFIEDEAIKLPALPPEFLKLVEDVQFTSVAFIPVIRNEKLATVLVVGTGKNQPLPPASIEPYAGVAELVTSALDRIRREQEIEHRLVELEAITNTSQTISSAKDMQSLYGLLHDRVRQYMGDHDFQVVLYNSGSDSISIPYLYERGEILTKESNLLGDDLTSVLIRTKQPLMIVENAEQMTIALGVKASERPAKSWLGAPLVIAGEAIGAIIVQDTWQEYAFDAGDLRFLTTLTAQVAGAIYNARLLEDTRKRALALQTTAEIGRDISGSLDLDELLANAVALVRDRFGYYFSAIYLVEPNGEFASIREGTGEAGSQMKRVGHKLKIGSKSPIGNVTANAEPLLINDTAKDANYSPNPLLPDTKAEIAFPLKVGTRILGALDVHSTQPFSFNQDDINVLRILADQLAVAVINSELFAETQEHLSQHRLIHHVTTAAASGTTIEEALNSATQGLQVTLGGDRVAIMLANKDKRILEIRSVAGYSEDVKQVVIPFGSGITGWVATHQQPQRIEDVTQDPRYIQVGSNVRSELAIPLVYRGELLGILNVESDQVGAYSENDEELLGTLGGTLAAIISNARLIDQIRRQVDRERLLYEVTSKIRRSTDMQTIMATTTSELSKVLGARRAQIQIDVDNQTKDDKTIEAGS